MSKKPKVMSFGKHKGKLYSAIPLPYLQWLVDLPNNGRHRAFPERTLARKEINRRKAALKNEEVPQFIKDMAEAEFGEGTFADWYNQKSD